jgi:hypothetical protein
LASIINKEREIVTEDEANVFRQRFFELYPVIPAWHHEVWKDVKDGKIATQAACAEALKFTVKEFYGALPQDAH